MQTSLFAWLAVYNHSVNNYVLVLKAMEIARTGVGSRIRRSYGDAIFIVRVTGSALYGISASSKVSFRVSKHFGQPNEYEKTYSR